jgi:NAD(P)-dependent dehydrogenase (short-subunit alcohol dehydrogenase family)
MQLEDKVAIVTGGTSGIGLATVRRFVEEGARVVVLAKEEPECRALAQLAADKQWEVRTVAGDVSHPSAWTATLTEAGGFGTIDILVNNAGYGIQGSVPDTSLEDWEGLFRTNVTGTFLGCQAVLPQMLEAGRGSIVNVASVAGQIGMSRRAAYCASKAAVVGLTRAMAVDHSAHGVRTNAVAPGTTDSPYFDKIAADLEDPTAYRRYLAERQLVNRLADPVEIAEAIVFLASDASSFATGSVVTVDGGMSVA